MITILLFYFLQFVNQFEQSPQLKSFDFGTYPTLNVKNVDSLLINLSPNDSTDGIIVNDTSLIIFTYRFFTPGQAINSPQIRYTVIRYSASLKLLFNNSPYIRSKIVTELSALMEFNCVYTTFFDDIIINKFNASSQLSFDSTHFKGSFLINNISEDININNNVYINKSIFNKEAEFKYNYLNSFNINNSVFKTRFALHPSDISSNKSTIKNIQFKNVSFSGFTSLRNISTNSLSDLFITCKFSDTLEIGNIDFISNIDLNRTDLSNLTVLWIEDFNYNNGELICDWENIKGYKFPKIQLSNPTNDVYDNYYRIERIYKKLRNNYLAQGDKISADAVMHELAWQKEIITKSSIQYLYGLVIGYGYEPWRFFFWVILIGILPFYFVYYFFYFGLVNEIIREPESAIYPRFKTIKKLTVQWKIVDHTSVKYARILKSLVCLYFSFAVLLGIRLKKEWFRDNKTFLRVIIAQYLFGLSLYLAFFLMMQTSQFDSFKSLLGF